MRYKEEARRSLGNSRRAPEKAIDTLTQNPGACVLGAILGVFCILVLPRAFASLMVWLWIG